MVNPILYIWGLRDKIIWYDKYIQGHPEDILIKQRRELEDTSSVLGRSGEGDKEVTVNGLRRTRRGLPNWGGGRGCGSTFQVERAVRAEVQEGDSVAQSIDNYCWEERRTREVQASEGYRQEKVHDRKVRCYSPSQANKSPGGFKAGCWHDSLQEDSHSRAEDWLEGAGGMKMS